MALARPGGRAPRPTTGSIPSGTRSSGTGTGLRFPRRSRRAKPSSSSRRWSRRGHRAATASRSTSWRSFATGSRSSDPRRSISPWRSGRGSTHAAWLYGCTALPIPTSMLPLLRRPSRSSPTTRSPSRTSSPARFRHRTGRVCCSTHTRRGMERSEGRSRRSRAPIAAATRPGLRAAVATRASASRFSSRHSSTASSPETYQDLPAYAGSDALFDGRAVVRLRSRSGRRSD